MSLEECKRLAEKKREKDSAERYFEELTQKYALKELEK